MGFRDDRVAQRGRIDSLESELDETKEALEEARAELDRLRAESEPREPPDPPPAYRPGEYVWVRWNGTWYRAQVLSVAGKDRFHVAYQGYSAKWNETVGPDRIRPRGAGPPASAKIVRALLLAVALAAGALGWWALRDTAPPGVPVGDVAELSVGQRVQVSWNGGWYEAEVLAHAPDGRVLVRYVGYESRWDEAVGPDRLRR